MTPEQVRKERDMIRGRYADAMDDAIGVQHQEEKRLFRKCPHANQNPDGYCRDCGGHVIKPEKPECERPRVSDKEWEDNLQHHIG